MEAERTEALIQNQLARNSEIELDDGVELADGDFIHAD